MSVDELLPYLKENRKQLIQQVQGGKEEKGKVRKLGIPSLVDRVIQ